MKTALILGTAQNLREIPQTLPHGTEVWMANADRNYQLRCPRTLGMWTRWFNLHSKEWMNSVYPASYQYLQLKADGRPVYFQKVQADCPTSITFPRSQIQQRFATSDGPNRYFTCTACWLIALAIFEGFERIELWGFGLSAGKYAPERPCVAYWIAHARSMGIEVFYQEILAQLYADGLMVPGNPDTYDGPLYGFETKPESDWDFTRGCFQDEDC